MPNCVPTVLKIAVDQLGRLSDIRYTEVGCYANSCGNQGDIHVSVFTPTLCMMQIYPALCIHNISFVDL